MKGQYGNLLEKTISVQEKYNHTLSSITNDVAKGLMNDSEMKTVMENLNKGLRDQLGIEASYELSKQLTAVRNQLKPSEWASAQQKLFSDLASGLGIAEYLKSDDSLASRQQELAEVYGKLIQYANASNMANTLCKGSAAAVCGNREENASSIKDEIFVFKP